MSAYTNTYIRIDALTNEQVSRLVEHAVDHYNHTWYYTGMKDKPKETLKRWLDLHHKNRDYFIECGMKPEDLTEEALTARLYKNCNETTMVLKQLEEVQDGKLPFETVVKDDGISSPYLTIKRNGVTYIDPRHEVFRLRVYYDGEFSTVDEIINFIRKFKDDKRFIDFHPDPNDKHRWEWQTLTPELEAKIRNYYEKIGDGNFIVRFG